MAAAGRLDGDQTISKLFSVEFNLKMVSLRTLRKLHIKNGATPATQSPS